MVFSKIDEIKKTEIRKHGTGPGAPCTPSRPRILGILNVTPDSFSDGGRYETVNAALCAAQAMLAAGADAIDIGGESTRPGSDAVPVAEERERVVPVLEAIMENSSGDTPVISIDTRRAEVARLAAERGAAIINDTSALRDDPELVHVIREHHLDVVLMHRLGTPRTMQRAPDYADVVREVREFFQERVAYCGEHGIAPQRIILDPGLGFGKTVDHNYALTRALPELRIAGTRLMVGASRKSFLGRYDERPARERLPGSLAFAARATEHRAEWVRVHDVLETRVFLNTLTALENERER